MSTSVPGHESWVVTVEVDVTDAPEIVSLQLMPHDHPRSPLVRVEQTATGAYPLQREPLSSSILRAIAIPTLKAWVDEALDEAFELDLVDLRLSLSHQDTVELRLARVASEYLRAIADPETRSRPRQTAAKVLGITAERVRDDLHAARRRGLLTSSGPGRAGGTLTSRARAILIASE